MLPHLLTGDVGVCLVYKALALATGGILAVLRELLTTVQLSTSPEEGLRLLTCGMRGKAYCPYLKTSRGGRKKSTVGQPVG